MCLPRVGALGLLNFVKSLGRDGQVHWRMRCSKCAQTLGAYAVGVIVTIARKFHRGRALLDFEETWLDIAVMPYGLG